MELGLGYGIIMLMTLVVNNEDEDSFFQHVNCVNDNIKFTEEFSTDNKLVFLYCLIGRRTDGFFNTPVHVYRKPMHNDQYLLFQSKQPTNQFTSLV